MSVELTPNQELWLAALESGEYSQIRHRLGNQEGYCCLGVACEVALANGVAIEKDAEDEQEYQFDGNTVDLPQAVVEWLEVPDYNPDVQGTPLAAWNDNFKLTFLEISAKIRETGFDT